MKQLITVLALALILVLTVSPDLPGNETRFDPDDPTGGGSEGGSGGGSEDDDHPWGGEGMPGGDTTDDPPLIRHRGLVTTSGYLAIDLVFSYMYTWWTASLQIDQKNLSTDSTIDPASSTTFSTDDQGGRER